MVLAAAPLNGLVGLNLPDIFGISASAVIESGTFGTDNALTWQFNSETKEFTVSGTGVMPYSYSTSNPAPWADFRDEIVTVTIGEGVKNVGTYSFYKCTSLKNVNIPDTVTWISDCAFEKSSIESIVIPDSVTHIGVAAFRGCKLLESIKLSANLITIENYAFDDCTSLTSLMIPASVTSIVCNFKSCSSLTELIVEEGNTNYVSDEYGVLYTGSFAALKAYPVASVQESYTVNEATKTIYKNAFAYNQNLKTVILPEGLEKINGDAFYGCKMLETVVIPTSIITIGTDTDAFSNCTSLKTVSYNGTEHDWMLSPDNELKNLDGVTYNFLGQAENNGHTYELITDIEPTETQHGEKAYSCSCGHSYSELLHNYIVDPNMPEVPPTCGSNGKRYYICTVCGDEYAEMLPKGGEHSYQWVLDHAPTATETGLKWQRCIYCGTKAGWYIQATGFEWSESLNIDFLTGVTYGINPGTKTMDNYTQIVNEAYVWSYDTDGYIGTGTQVKIMEGDVVKATYTLLLYGDINGDGFYDGQDAVIVSCLANGMLTYSDVGELAFRAADCNHDEIVDDQDVWILNEAGALLAEVNQSGESQEEMYTSSAYAEYVQLIDQTTDVEIEAEPEKETTQEPEDTTVPDTNEGAESEETTPEQDNAEQSFFDIIIAFIKSIIEMLLTYIPVAIK